MFYDVHAHIFNYKNVPDRYLGMKLSLTDKLCRWIHDKYDVIIPGTKDRLNSVGSFIDHFLMSSEDNLKYLLEQYPDNTIINVLLMDLISMKGEIQESYEQQILNMVELKKKYKDKINLFMHLDINRDNMWELFEDFFITGNSYFKGIKLYPSLNSPVTDKRLDPVFKYCERNRIPIITHAGCVGVTSSTIFEFWENRHSNPQHWSKILEKYPYLKINFAHFGGYGYMVASNNN